MVKSFRTDLRTKQIFYRTGKQKKNDCYLNDGCCDFCKTVFEAMCGYYNFCYCQEIRLSLSDKDIERGNEKRDVDELRRDYKEEKGYTIQVGAD